MYDAIADYHSIEWVCVTRDVLVWYTEMAVADGIQMTCHQHATASRIGLLHILWLSVVLDLQHLPILRVLDHLYSPIDGEYELREHTGLRVRPTRLRSAPASMRRHAASA